MSDDLVIKQLYDRIEAMLEYQGLADSIIRTINNKLLDIEPEDRTKLENKLVEFIKNKMLELKQINQKILKTY